MRQSRRYFGPRLGGEPGLWTGSYRLPPGALLAGPGLRNGDVLQLGQPGDRDLSDGAVLRVHVTGVRTRG